ncbi:MAG: LysM peptidoglycan-binding domain-containing protein [Planctomycetota bacterium]|nr:LysM peptidoglycan-binding domain-containing protein [Planctomycetota bacterium]
MIRLAFSIGTLAILIAVGVLVWRWVGQETQTAAGDLPDVGTPPAAPPAQDGPGATMPQVPTGPYGVAQPPAPVPAPEAPAPSPLPPLEPLPVQSPPPAPAPEAPSTRAGLRTHKVQPGDSLWKISMKYYGDARHIQDLAQANRLDGAGTIRPGQVLILPDAGTARRRAPADADHELADEPSSHDAPRPEPADRDFVPMPPSLNRSVPRDRTSD